MAIAKCGDLNIEYYDEGSGPPLLMIMGLGGQASSWGEPIMEELRGAFRCIRMSNRGTGDSDPAPALRKGGTMPSLTVRDMAEDAAALLDALGIESAHVFGVSMGGMIAQELALNHPQRVDRLVLGCTTAGGPKSVAADAEVIAALVPQSGLTREEQVRKMWPAVTTEAMVTEGAAFLEEMMRAGLEKPTPVETMMKQVAAVQSFNAYDRLPQVKAPALIIHGDADRLVPPENARILHERIPDSRLEILPGAAHVFFWEQPKESARLVREWLL